MREFDHNGLILATFQAKIFEQSTTFFNCSSLVFLRRFMKSKVAKKIDQNNSYILSLDYLESLKQLELEFGKSDYGQNKFSKEEMFWMGYIYRYICYTRECSTRFIFKLFPPQELQKLYFVYHTQSEEWVIQSLLELKNKNQSYLDKNKRIKNKLLAINNYSF